MPGYGMKKKPMMKHGGKVKRKNYGHGGGAMVVTISKVKDKDKKIVSGDSEKIKTVYDTWVFSKNIKSSNPNWLLINTIT